MHTFSTPHFYSIQNLINSLISIHFGRRNVNYRTVYCHLTVVNFYIQCIHLHIPIDIDMCTYTLGGGIIGMLTREILLSFIKLVNKKTITLDILSQSTVLSAHTYI